MNKRQFLAFVCTLMMDIVCFCFFMQSNPSAWSVLAMVAFLIVVGIIVYYFLNWSIKVWFE